MKRKIVISLSGGMDSTVLFWNELTNGSEVKAISFNYGQRHSKELARATAIVDTARAQFGVEIEHKIVDLSGLHSVFGANSQTDDAVAVPHGHYAAESMKLTVVPNRNMIMLSVASAWALATGCELVGYAAHSGDHAIYPDCRATFALALGEALLLCDERFDGHGPKLSSPFIHISKTEICRRGGAIDAPFELTWSCYEGGDHHCGRCGTCMERAEAFRDSGVADPTVYANEPRSAEELAADTAGQPENTTETGA